MLLKKYNGVCNLRFDDTNPSKENNEYVENILQDIQWLGFKWGNIYYASDYFEKLWEFAVWMIKKGHAYIDEQTAEQIAEQKGTPTTPGTASPYRDRPIEESLALFEKMNTPEAAEVWCFVPSSIWLTLTCTSVTQSCIVSFILHIIVLALSGMLILCMILLMDRVTTLRV